MATRKTFSKSFKIEAVRLLDGGHYPSFDGPRYRELIKAWLEEKGA